MAFVLNPFTGKLTVTDSDQAAKTITHERTSAGNLMKTFDATLSIHLSAGPMIVINNSGAVVRRN